MGGEEYARKKDHTQAYLRSSSLGKNGGGKTTKKLPANDLMFSACARGVGASVESAGQIIKETAELVDSLAKRAKARTQTKASGSKKRR